MNFATVISYSRIQRSLTGEVNPMPELTLSPSQGSMNSATVLFMGKEWGGGDDIFADLRFNAPVNLIEGLIYVQMRDGVPAHMRSKYPVQCFPLYSIILAMGNPT